MLLVLGVITAFLLVEASGAPVGVLGEEGEVPPAPGVEAGCELDAGCEPCAEPGAGVDAAGPPDALVTAERNSATAGLMLVFSGEGFFVSTAKTESAGSAFESESRTVNETCFVCGAAALAGALD